MDYTERETEMARRFYGYGRWDAPYWFIGPEQGKGPTEAQDNALRLHAWVRLDEPELCDCHQFHCANGEQHWHSENPRLQRTWRSLILLLMTFLGKPSDNESLRAYQRDRWGMARVGETCVIELCAFAAKSYKVPIDRESFRRHRIETIRQRMLEHKPDFVIMYGASDRKHWTEIAGGDLEPDKVEKHGSTLFAFTSHPVAHGRKDSDWAKLGEILRRNYGALERGRIL